MAGGFWGQIQRAHASKPPGSEAEKPGVSHRATLERNPDSEEWAHSWSDVGVTQPDALILPLGLLSGSSHLWAQDVYQAACTHSPCL